MKKILLICLLLSSAALCCYCQSVPPHSETGEKESDPPPLETEEETMSNIPLNPFTPGFFDRGIKHKPKESDIKAIHKGMALPDIVSVIGKPHRFLPDEGIGLTYIWYTTEENVYAIRFRYDEDGNYFSSGSPRLVNEVYDEPYKLVQQEQTYTQVCFFMKSDGKNIEDGAIRYEWPLKNGDQFYEWQLNNGDQFIIQFAIPEGENPKLPDDLIVVDLRYIQAETGS